MTTVYVYADTAAEEPPFFRLDAKLDDTPLGPAVEVSKHKADTWRRAMDLCNDQREAYWQAHFEIADTLRNQTLP